MAPVYDASVGLRDLAAARARFDAVARRHGLRFRSAADLGCGTGLFARELAARRGVPVIGVDRSPEMLAVARRNCRDPRVLFLLQDLRSLRLPSPVGVATAHTMTVNHLVDPCELRGALCRIQAALLPGAHLVFDFATDRQPLPGGGYVARFRAGDQELEQVLRWHPATRRITASVGHALPGAEPEVELYTARGYAPAEIAAHLAAAGFDLRALYRPEDLDLAPGLLRTLVAVARRR